MKLFKKKEALMYERPREPVFHRSLKKVISIPRYHISSLVLAI